MMSKFSASWLIIREWRKWMPEFVLVNVVDSKILGDPYSKKNPIPNIGGFLCLADGQIGHQMHKTNLPLVCGRTLPNRCPQQQRLLQ
jgi:hypothetical protein